MRTVANRLICTVLAAICIVSVVQAEEYYVDPAGNHVHPYTNLADAANTIQSALEAASATASATDIVWIAEGDYTATNAVIPVGGTNVLYVDKPIALRALGSAANTIINGEGSNRCIYVAYDVAEPDNWLVLDHITLTNGSASYGGAIYLDGGPTLNNKFRLKILNSWITDCVATDGGGICAENDASGSCALYISNSVIRNCAAANDGGAVWLDTRAPIDVYDSVFTGNNASHDHDVIFASIFGSRCTLERTEIRQNGSTANDYGVNLQKGRMTLRNCLLYDNTHIAVRGYHNSQPCEIDVDNCTIVSNSGGIRMVPQSYTTQYLLTRNSIIHGNTSFDFDVTVHLNGSYTNNCIASTNGIANFYANGNITNAPTFVDPAHNDLRLTADSYGLNAGANLPWMVGATDLDGGRRIDRTYGIVDMGCYELNYRGTTIMVQ